MVLYVASDLIWATRIKATAEDLGLPARPVRSLDMLEARLGDSPVRGLIADLETPELALAAIRRLRTPPANERERGVRVVAFGPHLHKDALQAARDAGADEVLPRGAFDHALPDILTRMMAADRSA